MATPGRNDLCPCDSGKKYKQCCMLAERESQRRRDECMQGQRAALDWLFENHEEACGTAIAEEFYAALDDEEMNRLNDDPVGMFELSEVLAEDWLLAEATLSLEDDSGESGDCRALERVLGSGGATLTPMQRTFLEALGRSTCGLYEVESIGVSPSLTMRDRLFPERPPFAVTSRALADQATAGEVFLIRLVSFAGEWVTSGVLCPVSPGLGSRIQIEAGEFIAKHGITWETAATRVGDDTVGAICRDLWIIELAHPAPPPRMVDRATREPLLLITDHYDVLDWDGLARSLANEPDLEGDATRGWTWLHPATSADAMRSTRWALNPDRVKNRLACFARSQKPADDGRAWLEALARDSVRHLVRDIVDPRSPAALEEFRSRASAEPKDPLADLSPDQRRDVFQQVHEKIYAQWAEKPIPVLGGKTPREAIGTPAGRAQVEQLVRDYERTEARRSAAEGRPPVDYGFLWQSLGMEPTRS